MQVPAPFEYERATSVEHALELLRDLGPEARILAGGHSLLPMMKLRLASPGVPDRHRRPGRRARLRARGRRRDQDRRHDPPPRAARIRAAGGALGDLHRRRARDRRPGRPQPRDDRRRPLPGRPVRGPERGLRGDRRPDGDPRARRRAHARHARVPPRPLPDRRRRRRDAGRDPGRRSEATPAAPTRSSTAASGTGRWRRPAPRSSSTAASSPTPASRSPRSASPVTCRRRRGSARGRAPDGGAVRARRPQRAAAACSPVDRPARLGGVQAPSSRACSPLRALRRAVARASRAGRRDAGDRGGQRRRRARARSRPGCCSSTSCATSSA